jgi:hypothetical protein
MKSRIGEPRQMLRKPLAHEDNYTRSFVVLGRAGTEGVSRLRKKAGSTPLAAYVTRVMGFSWDKRLDRLWRQGIDLIGDDGGDDVGEGIADRPMLGQSEGREFLDVTDYGFDDVAPVEQGLVLVHLPFCKFAPA